MGDVRLYSMDELAFSWHCTRAQAAREVWLERIPVVRYRGNSYVYESELVRYLMKKHNKKVS